MLACFAAQNRSGPVKTVVDLGAGVGTVALALHYFVGIRRAELVEREQDLSELACANLEAQGVDGSVHVVDLDKDGLPRELRAVATAVVCNPPFFTHEANRAHKEPALSRARSGRLAPFITAAAAALGRRGKAFFVYPAASLTHLLLAAEERHLVAKRMRLVHPFADAPARIALVELARAKPGGLVVEPSLVEWQSRGVRSPELSALMDGRVSDRK